MFSSATIRVWAVFLVANALLAFPAGAHAADYDQLVFKANSDLKAGRFARALTESGAAIAIAPRRWSAYVVAGGASQMEGDYDRAINDFSKSLQLAPEGKRAAIRGLLRRCLSAEASAQPRSGSGSGTAASGGSGPASRGSAVAPSYSETAQWIQAHIGAAGDPAANGHPCGTCTWSQKYLISFDGCSTMTVSVVDHRVDLDPDPQFRSDVTFQEEFVFPISSTKMNRSNTGGWLHLDPSADGLLAWREIGVPDSVRSTHSASIPSRVTDISDWKTFTDAGGGFAAGPDDSSAPGVTIPFELPGTESVAPHFVNAINHLLEICRGHADEVPTSAF